MPVYHQLFLFLGKHLGIKVPSKCSRWFKKNGHWTAGKVGTCSPSPMNGDHVVAATPFCRVVHPHPNLPEKTPQSWLVAMLIGISHSITTCQGVSRWPQWPALYLAFQGEGLHVWLSGTESLVLEDPCLVTGCLKLMREGEGEGDIYIYIFWERLGSVYCKGPAHNTKCDQK